MLTTNEINGWSLDKCNEELGAAGHYSCHNDVSEAREALVAMLAEYGIVRPIQVVVYWDRSDIENQGWAYRASYAGDREESGSLSANELHEAIDEACAILGIDDHAVEFAISSEEGGYAMWSLPQ